MSESISYLTIEPPLAALSSSLPADLSWGDTLSDCACDENISLMSDDTHEWEMISPLEEPTGAVWARLPPEITWLVVESAKERDTFGRPDRSMLNTFVSVCRAWLEQCARVLYGHIHIDGRCQSVRVEALLMCLLAQSSLMRHYTSSLHVQHCELGPVSGAFSVQSLLCRIPDLLPNLTDFVYEEEGVSDQKLVSASSWPKMLSAFLSGFKTITDLRLTSCAFHSSLDILRLIAELPALTNVLLVNTEWRYVPEAIPRRKLNHLSTIATLACTAVWPMIWFYALAHHSRGDATLDFPGLTFTEAFVFADVARLCSTGSFPIHEQGWFEVKQSACPYAWAIVLYKWTQRIEFHFAEAPEALDELRERRCWLVFHFCESITELVDVLSLEHLDKRLSELFHLEKIVFERKAGEKYHIPDALANIKDKIRLQTWEESL